MPERRDQLLKTWPEHFRDIRSGVKTFEVRLDDRGFRVGDHLVLLEYDPLTTCYSGETERRVVTHLLSGGQFGIAPGYVVMSLAVANA